MGEAALCATPPGAALSEAEKDSAGMLPGSGSVRRGEEGCVRWRRCWESVVQLVAYGAR